VVLESREVLARARLAPVDGGRADEPLPLGAEQELVAPKRPACLEVLAQCAAGADQILERLLGADLGAPGARRRLLGGDPGLRLLDEPGELEPRLRALCAGAARLEARTQPALFDAQELDRVLRALLQLRERGLVLLVVRPALLPLVSALLLEGGELVMERGEAPGAREIGEIRKPRGERFLLPGRERGVQAVELERLLGRERELGALGDRPRQPVVQAPRCGEPPRRLGGRDRRARHLDLAVLALHGALELPAELALLPAERGAPLLEPLDLLRELLLARRGEGVHDPGDRLLELLGAGLVALEHTHAQGPERLRELVAHHAQRLRGVARDQDALVLREQVPDQVRDRVALAGAGRPLHEDRARLLEPADHRLLLLVGGLGEQEVDRPPGLAGGGGAPGLDPHDAQQGLRELAEIRQGLEVAVDALGEPEVAVAEEEVGMPVEMGSARPLALARGLEEEPVRPESLYEVAQEGARRGAVERVRVLALDGVAQVLDPLAVEAHVAQERRVELRVVLGVDDRELRDGRVEAQLDALQEHGVADRPARVVEDEDPVAEEELVLLGLALEARAQVEEVCEDSERLDDLALAVLPGALAREPLLEGQHALLRVVEALQAPALDLARRPHDLARVGVDLVEAREQPVLDHDRGLRALGDARAPDLDDELPARRFAVFGLAREPIAAPHALGLERCVEWQHPVALLELHDGRRAHAVHLLQVAEDLPDPRLGGQRVDGLRQVALPPCRLAAARPGLLGSGPSSYR
jgi:hypothetical protein